MECDSPSASDDRSGSSTIITFREIKEKMEYMADFLAERGEPPNSQVLRQLRNAGVFGESVLRAVVRSCKFSFENLLARLNKDVLLTEGDRDGMRVVFTQVTAWAHGSP